MEQNETYLSRGGDSYLTREHKIPGWLSWTVAASMFAVITGGGSMIWKLSERLSILSSHMQANTAELEQRKEAIKDLIELKRDVSVIQERLAPVVREQERRHAYITKIDVVEARLDDLRVEVNKIEQRLRHVAPGPDDPNHKKTHGSTAIVKSKIDKP